MIEEKTVHLKGFINPKICMELLEAGFLHSILISEETLKIFNQLPSRTVIGDFIHWLSDNNVSRTQMGGIRIISAPPLFENNNWMTIREFLYQLPEIHPAVHLLLESISIREEEQVYKLPIPETMGINNKLRNQKLHLLRRVFCDKPESHHVWRDDKRFLSLALNEPIFRSHLKRELKQKLMEQMPTIKSGNQSFYSQAEDEDDNAELVGQL